MSAPPEPIGRPAASRDPEAFPGHYARTRRGSIGVPRNVTVLDAERVLFLRSRSGNDPVLCLWSLDRSGNEQLLVDPAEIGIDESDLPAAERARRERARESAGGIVGYAVDGGGRLACFALAGALYVVDLTNGDVSAPPARSPVFDPRPSPDGSTVAYVSGDDLRVVELATADDRALAIADDESVSWGRADFIAAEEMQRSRGYWWGPDSRKLLLTRVDESWVQTWWIADPAHPDRAPNAVRYPAAGTANASVELHLIDLDGSTQPVAWSDDDRFEYLANVVWSGEHPPLVVRQTRGQREVSIASLDLDTLALTERRRITDDVWVELIASSPTPCERGLLTVEDLSPGASDADPAGAGHRALVLDGRPLTGPDVHVRSIVGVVAGRVIVTAWTVPTEIHVLAVDLDGGDPVALTDVPGVHGAAIGGSDGQGALVALTSATPTTEGTTVTLRALTSSASLGDPLALVADHSLRSPIAAAPTFCQLGADRLESAVFFPTGYDGTDKLPVLLDPYGGPHAQRVLKTHTPHLVSQWFADQGFVVVVTDGRGTPGRGPAWERQVWGDLAEPVLTDQIEALDAAVEEFELLDLDRVAIRGWSFGGYLAALAALRRPDRIHAAIAGAPVTSWRLYDTHYTERYLGRPDLQPIHYEQTDLLGEADRLSRPLLLIHGLADDNVVAAHTLQFSSALLAAGAPHRVLPLSGVTHMTPQEVVAENLLWLQLDFLRETLGRPADA
ncbi:MAG: prolyl oligopeptidase family serine peptidase [Actinomycetota bacterium]